MAASEKVRAGGPEHKFPRSLYDLPPDFFDSCRLLFHFQSSHLLPPLRPSSSTSDLCVDDHDVTDRMEEPPSLRQEEAFADANKKSVVEAAAAATGAPRWTCNTCRSEFDSLLDQRSHFKSDLHRLNVKLNIAGKKTIKEEDFDEFEGDPLFENFDVSSISGSEDELEKVSLPYSDISGKRREGSTQKLYFHLQSGEMISIWRSLIMDEAEDLLLENRKSDRVVHDGGLSYVEEAELINRLKLLVREPRDKKHTRIVLLVSGGHFAGCVFDGNTVVAHKTFHRYVVRAKAGKKQSSKDATGKAAHSAGSALRRYNEAALKKDIQELLISWKMYIDSSSCIFVYAPAKNRQVLFDMDNPHSGLHNHIVRNIPLTVRRPTLKEAKRVYNHLTLMTFEIEAKSILEEVTPSCGNDEGNINQPSIEKQLEEKLVIEDSSYTPSSSVDCMLAEGENIGLSTSENITTPLHEAAKSGDVHRIFELLEEGLNPCLKDARGRTPYMLATEKEVRNTFRRYMASNPDKWDWHAANVPSPLTKEMEESQTAKQAEKDAKRKAKAKELKKLRKAKEKAKSQAAQSQGPATLPVSTAKQTPQSNRGIVISKEEEQRRALEAEREKRAAAAEKRIAALNVQKVPAAEVATTSSEPNPKGASNDVICSCCSASLAGKIPFHRYNYKYCSTTCMHVHREILEDG